jgi:hypothetical protein
MGIIAVFFSKSFTNTINQSVLAITFPHKREPHKNAQDKPILPEYRRIMLGRAG